MEIKTISPGVEEKEEEHSRSHALLKLNDQDVVPPNLAKHL